MEKKESRDFDFVIETPDGPTPRLTVAVPDSSLSFSELVPFMQTLADSLIDIAVQKAEKGDRHVTCGPSCGVCCCQLIPLSAPEVFFIIGKLLEMPLEQRTPILRRFEAIEKRLEDSGLMKKIRSLAGRDADINAVAKEYFYLKEPCPFLVEQSCSVHAWRPIVCREFNALSDPAKCADPFVNKIDTVPLFKRPSSVLALLASRLCGISSGLIPMPLIFDWHENNKGLSKKSWPADMLIKKVIEITVEPSAKTKPAT